MTELFAPVARVALGVEAQGLNTAADNSQSAICTPPDQAKQSHVRQLRPRAMLERSSGDPSDDASQPRPTRP